MSQKILFLVNVDWFLVSHRLPIALAAIKEGFEVHVACQFTDRVELLESLGFHLYPLPLSRSGTKFFSEICTILAIAKVIRVVKPDIIHSITIKPVIYGGILSRLYRIPGRVLSISGLGFSFVAPGGKNSVILYLIKKLYKIALKHKNQFIVFQNTHDRLLITGLRPDTLKQSVLIRGSGVNLDDYSVHPLPAGTSVVIMASRLLVEKGVREYVEAARILKEENYNVIFRLIGSTDSENRGSIPESEITEWRNQGIVEISGHSDSIADKFSNSHIVCLPSYREGLPKVLIEAAACGRAVVTTDVPGCKDAIVSGRTGILVPPRDSQALASAIKRLLQDPVLTRELGLAGRELAEREFNIDGVVNKHILLYNSLILGNPLVT